MRKIITLLITIVSLGIAHWIITFLLNASYIDFAVPFGIVAIFIVYMFTMETGRLNRQMNLEVHGLIEQRMDFINRINSMSFVFLGSVIYFLLMIVATFFIYREYFFN
ncbi:hypothetical protein ACFVR1_18890 [Psychrobacillus sp. NPDC058041]|uniref:hypothetical protein n=1 Tax=Psychrobacillus sp. NPDC058041 TaxID=3346310 RepID=UPI0036DAB653